MRSIQARVALWLAMSLVLVFGLLAFVLRDFPRYLTEEYIETRLQHDAESLYGRLTFDADGQLALTPGPVAPIYAIPESGHYYAARWGGKVLQSGSLGAGSLDIDWLANNLPAPQYSRDPSGSPLLVWVEDYFVKNQRVRVAIAEDITHLDQHLAAAQRHYFLATAIVLAAILALQALVVRWSLTPLDNAREALKKLAQGEVETIEAEVPSEIQPLVDEINRLGLVMQKQLKRSRTAIGNLAHAMKTPLAAIQQTLAEVGATDVTVKSHIQQQLDQIRHSVDRELRRARLAGSGLPGQRFDPAAEVPVLLEVLEKIYSEKGLKLTFRSSLDGGLNVDRADMLELLGNLLDNACKWAIHSVVIDLSGDDRFQLTVEDDGPGVDVGQMASMGDRGLRLDESLPGHGLGLAIVTEIVEDYGGTMDFGTSKSLGGLRVTVRLPRVPGAQKGH